MIDIMQAHSMFIVAASFNTILFMCRRMNCENSHNGGRTGVAYLLRDKIWICNQ